MIAPPRRRKLAPAFAFAACFAFALPHASSQRRPDDVVRLVRVAPIAAPVLSSTEVADYVGLVMAILDSCARSAPNRALPFAGRARLVVTVTTAASTVEVLDVEPGLEDLRERCLATAPALPPLEVPSIATWPRGPGYGRFALDVVIDARGFPPAPTGRRTAPTRIAFDATTLTLHRHDTRFSNVQIRDELLRGVAPLSDAILRCFESESARDGYDGSTVRLDLRIDRNGAIRSVELQGRFGLPTCVRRVLTGVRFASWSPDGDTELSISLAAL